MGPMRGSTFAGARSLALLSAAGGRRLTMPARRRDRRASTPMAVANRDRLGLGRNPGRHGVLLMTNNLTWITQRLTELLPSGLARPLGL
jgi:hypothetical protein